MRILISRTADGKITLQETSKIAIITIRRDHAQNALTYSMWNELACIAKKVGANSKNKVLIIRGSSGQFSAGSDIKDFLECPQ